MPSEISHAEYEAFGRLLADARRNRKLTQGELAKSLHIQQQAVSRWERGVSRPETAEMAKALAVLFPEHDWVSLTEHDAKGKKSAAPSLLPVRPLSASLPLHSLTPEQFEDFCRALLNAYFEGETVHQYGVPGDKQRGIDIDVQFNDGRYYTFQCKREAKFGKEKVRRAIQAHTIDCDLAVILLSRIATAESRDEVKKRRRKKWTIWDAKDIADRIRALHPKHKQLHLIDTYFPAYRKDFLGIDQPSVFETPEKYFAPYLTRSHIFSHSWTLVGRDEKLTQVRDMLSGQNEGAIIIVGPGGIGKTRFLRAVIEDHKAQNPESPVFVLPSSAQPTPEDYEILAGQQGLVVLEDAHDRVNTKAIAHALARIQPPQRVIVTCRPYALSATCGDLESAGLPVAGLPLLIGGLSKLEAEGVAREILNAKNGPEPAAKEIAAVAYDSPLALVVGAHLVATKLIHPKVLNNADEFRRRLLEGFRDAITGTIGLPAEATLIRGTLELIALLQPLEVDTNAFTAVAAKLTSQPVPEIKRAIQLLLEAGVLIRRARKLRIVPDLLGDYLIEEVLRRDSGGPSGSARQLLAEADVEQVANLLVNTAKLDWRLSAKDDSGRRLSDIVWAQLISGSSETLPEKLRDGVTIAAYYQPEPALALYDRIAKAGEPKEFTRLLKHVAMNMEFVERACERLWVLGKKDDRAENQFPHHPMRILKELARVEPGKPVEYCGRIADFAMARINERDETLPLYGILESALNADGHTTESKGLSISFNSFTVRHDAVKELRLKIIGFLIRQLTSASLPSAVRAASAFSSALRFPNHGQSSFQQEWEAEFISTLDQLTEAVNTEKLNANTLVAIEKSVHGHAKYGGGPAHEAAERVIAAIPKTLEYRVTLCFVDAWGHTRMGHGDAKDWMERWRDEQTSLAKDVLTKYPSSTDVIAFIRRRLGAVRAAGDQRECSPGQFVGILASLDEQIAEAICEAAIAEPDMRSIFSAGLSALMHHNPAKGMEAAQRSLSTNVIELIREVSWTIGVRQGRGRTMPEERVMLRALVSSTDPHVVVNAIRGIVSGGLHDPSGLAAYLLTIDIGQSKDVASELFGEVTRHDALAQALTEPSLVERMLEKLQTLPTIEDFWIEKYLAQVSESAPMELTDFLLARIEADVTDTDHQLQPLPYLWDEKLPFNARKSPRFKDALRRIREWLLTAPNHWAVRFWAPKLYVAMAGGIDDEVVRDLLDWTDTHDPAKFGVVIDLLREAPSRFALNHVTAVRALFDRAEAVGGEAVDGLRSSLFAAAVSGMRHGTHGQPFPEDVQRKTKSQEALAQIPAGSPVAEFYVALARNAEGDIRRKKEDDEALIEEYE